MILSSIARYGWPAVAAVRAAPTATSRLRRSDAEGAVASLAPTVGKG